MDASTPPQLHDSLDLAALKQQAEAAKILSANGQKIRRYAMMVIVASFGVVLLFPMLFPSTSSPLLTVGLGLLGLMGLLITIGLIATSVMLVISYREYMRYIRRVNAYAPAFIPRPKRIILKFFSPLAVLSIILVVLTLVYGYQPIYVVFIVLIFAYSSLYRRFLMWTLKGGLPRVEKVLRFLPQNATLTDIKITHLLHEDRVDEAERLSHDFLIRSDRVNLSRLGLRLNNLGFGLTIDGQYEKALPLLEAAIQILPGYSNSYDSLAAWYLEQNYDPERALELSEIAVHFTVPEVLESRAIEQATSARALALTGRDSRAEALLTAAFDSLSQLPPYASAEVHRQVGHVRLAQNNGEAALEHFQKAIELDPDGIYGKLAQRALDSLVPPS